MKKTLLFSLIFMALTSMSALAQSHSVALSWNAVTATPTPTYNMYRSTTSGSGYVKLAAGTGLTALTFTDATVAVCTTYFYVVTAQNSNGESGFSTQATAVVPGCPPPAAPTGLTATAN